MAVLLQSLRLVDAHQIHPPKNYVFAGSEIVEEKSAGNVTYSETIDCSQYLGSRGWIDLRCASGDPGEEYRESLVSLGKTLTASGFAKAVLMPNTKPAIQSKNELQYLRSKTQTWVTDLLVQAAATKDCKGEDFTDILDLQSEGATVFGDGTHPIDNPDRLLKILQYLQKFDGILFDQSYDPLLAMFGQMHEGITSTLLGMKGIPNLAEEVAVHRNLEILKYAGGRLHIQTVSTKGAVESIRKAKKLGLNVTADVSLYQLLFSDEDLGEFDTNVKVVPPFRGEEDREALVKGLKDGTIDAIVSNHQPQDFDAKQLEFDLAAFGMIGLQTFLPGLNMLSEELGWPLLVGKITEGPAKVLGLSNTLDSLTVFDPEESWTYDAKSNLSLSANSPWMGKTLQGKTKLVINKQKLVKV